MEQADIGLVGLGVMGANLARNFESRGYKVSVYNRTTEVTEEFMASQQGRDFIGTRSLEELVQSLSSPRKVFLMVPAGNPVDQMIERLLPLLHQGDILIDGGNSYFKDTVRREAFCKEKGVFFLGIGVSGGEEGALKGASIMPGGPKEAWEKIAPMLEKVAAYADGVPCTTYIGPDGSGHFVKMVHNGIEYGDMQLIAEAYDLLRKLGKCSPQHLASVFSEWNKGVLQSFLIEITAKVFEKKDEFGEGFLVDKILDKAGQKGTGKWTVQIAYDLAVPIPTISAAVDGRVLSSLKNERVLAAKEFGQTALVPDNAIPEDFVFLVHDALYTAKILSYAQGMALLQRASDEWNWDLKLGEIAAIWKGGCIIRARFLGEIQRAYKEIPSLANLILSPQLKSEIQQRIGSLRKVVALAAEGGVPVPALAASLSYFDAYISPMLPQNLTQAQRDFFGAHTYERVDREGSFHTEWA